MSSFPPAPGIGGNGRRVIIAGGGKRHRASVSLFSASTALWKSLNAELASPGRCFQHPALFASPASLPLSGDIRIRDFLRNGSWVDHYDSG